MEPFYISLTPQLAELIRCAVSSGDYANNDEIFQEALRDWKSKRLAQSPYTAEEIQRLWDEGLASGPGADFDIERIKKEARKGFRRT